MIIFNVDIDNTLIYSYKHEIGNRKKCVEIYQGRQVSFMTERTQRLLREVSRHFLAVPTTTRTVEQYQRVQLGLKEVKYALVCNGGVLLEDGAEDGQWYLESLRSIAPAAYELERAERLLEEDSWRCYEIRNIKKLFLFTKSSRPEASAERLAGCLDASLVDVCRHGMKVYAVPKALNKGAAAVRLRERLGAEKMIAAGDSAFDLPMLECADLAIAPAGLVPAGTAAGGGRSRIVRLGGDGEGLFSEELLEYVLFAVRGCMNAGI